MKTIVVYYSRTGSNKYLAEKIAQSLNCDIEEIVPHFNLFFFVAVSSLLKKSPGIKTLRHNLPEYDKIVLCGPVFMGTFISPLRGFIRKYEHNIKQLYFACCCASSDATKDDKFGHGSVFKMAKDILKEKLVFCEAFPIPLVVPEDKQKDSDLIMKTRLSDSNFNGEIQKRFENFIQKLAE
ncbi:MAG: flavodoxin family protein [Bacteroidales bacterium]